MIVRKNLNLRGIALFAGHHMVWLTVWMVIMAVLYHYTHWFWLSIPWLPVSVIGTAVAFYVGFKNNQAYGRLWEARQVWGGVVNSSRMWASVNQSILGKTDSEAAKKLVYRYIAWTYTLRTQLLQPAQWEHVSNWGSFGKFNRKRRKTYGEGAFASEAENVNLQKYLDGLEAPESNGFSNQATYILNRQTHLLQDLLREKKLDLFQQLDLQKMVNDCYDHQGKLERIKRFPLPRQYGSFSFVFVCIFIFLLPFGIVGEFEKMGPAGIWLSIPFGVIVGWIYVVMEMIGDYSENPFEGLPYDVPMLAICRTIEIDSLNIIGDKEVPAPVAAKTDVLM